MVEYLEKRPSWTESTSLRHNNFEMLITSQSYTVGNTEYAVEYSSLGYREVLGLRIQIIGILEKSGTCI